MVLIVVIILLVAALSKTAVAARVDYRPGRPFCYCCSLLSSASVVLDFD
jgi:hypothetical protein